MNDSDSNVNVLVGLTLSSISKVDNDRIELKTIDGRSFIFFHSQDCRETVSIYDIKGKFSWLMGSPILKAKEEIRNEDPTDLFGVFKNTFRDSYTWTIHTLTNGVGDSRNSLARGI